MGKILYIFFIVFVITSFGDNTKADELKLIEKGNSLTGKYRMVPFFYYNEGGAVYSGRAGNAVGAMWEMASQYMSWQFYAGWITFENYHLQTFMG
jgi:hypothetical protein